MKTAKVLGTQSIIIVALTGAFLLGSGCTSTSGRTVYTSGQANQSYRVEFGTVTGVRSVVIDGTTDSRIGTYGGGAVGAAAASGVGSGTGRALATAGGGIVGAIAGQQIEKAVTRKEGYEINIALDNGDQIMVVQEEEKGGFQDGDRVRVMIGQGTTVVMH